MARLGFVNIRMNKMKTSDVEIRAKDLREGAGIGGWNMQWTVIHVPTKCSVQFETNGSSPQSQNKMRDRALMALELMVEIY